MTRHSLWLLVLVACVASTATAATFSVTSTGDAVDASPGDGTCASAAGVCTLRAAVQEANASPGFDDVNLPAGTFTLSLLGAGDDIAATGDLDVTQPLTIAGAGQDVTIIDGAAADRVLQVAANIPLTVRALTIRNGTVGAPGGGIAGETGAAITVTSVTFRLSSATTGGAIYASGAPLVVTGSRFESNLATTTAGALAHSGDSAGLEIRDSVFADNVAATGAGGAVAYGGTGPVTITGTTLQRNLGVQGGAIAVTSAGAFTMTDSTIEDSTTSGTGNTFGGALVQVSGTATLDGVTVRRNTTEGEGGGLVIAATGAMTIRGSTFEDNVAANGKGGLFVAAGGDVLVENTAVRRNRTFTEPVGGLQAVTSAGTVTLRGVALEDNTSLDDTGGALLAANGDVVVESTKVLRNAARLQGGGLSATASGTITVRDTTVQGNQAVNQVGGALFGSNGPSIDVRASTFADNLVFGTAGTGGGVVFIGTAPVTVTNATVSGNWAQTTGAGLLTSGNAVVVASSTFFGNVGGAAGAAIATTGGSVGVRGTVVGAGPFPSCAGALASEGDNLDQDGSCGLAGPGDRSGLDPELGPLADNGGPTPTHEPLGTSPLVDAFGGNACPATDQRGVARPTDGNGDGTASCDVGAVEFVDECPTDPEKRLPGACGCGIPDVDANANGAFDCLINAELNARIATVRGVVQGLTGEKTEVQKAARANVAQQADDLVAYVTANESVIAKTDPAAKLLKLAKKARKALRATRKGKGAALAKKKTRAGKALDALDGVVAP